MRQPARSAPWRWSPLLLPTLLFACCVLRTAAARTSSGLYTAPAGEKPEAAQGAPPPPPYTCGDLATSDTFLLSFQGSWSYHKLDPQNNPFDSGQIFITTYGDWGGRGPIFASPVALTSVSVAPTTNDAGRARAPRSEPEPPCTSLKGPFCNCHPGNCSCAACGTCSQCPHCVRCSGPMPSEPCALSSYVWRPDVATEVGTCGHTAITMEVAYLDNATACSRYSITPPAGAGDVTVRFDGVVGASSSSLAAQEGGSWRKVEGVHARGTGVVVDVDASVAYASPPYGLTYLNRSWVVTTDADATPTVKDSSYSWNVVLPASSGTHNVTFCVTEYEPRVPAGPLPPAPRFDVGPTTDNIDEWLAELSVPPATVPSNRYGMYNSWFQFWYNTEHDAGNWIAPVITPSMSTYGRGMWLWDSAFHVMSLVSGGNGAPRSLKLAGDQLRVLINAGKQVGHIPRVVGPVGIETTTQPPGILTWASLVYYNRTRDTDFLASAFEAFATNNEWYYGASGRGTPSGLCTWDKEDSGWDTSPRWDKGVAEAVDLNGWLHLDQLLLARMADLLGKPANASTWLARANASKAAFASRLWSEQDGVFWDRLPNGTSGGFVKVVTPATFWSLLAGIATPEQAKAQVASVLVPGKLLTNYPLPCVGQNERTFDPTNYWRGPTWINVNWLSALGMDCYGLSAQARMIREDSVTVVGMSPTPREYYDPITGGGLGAQNFMWTGAVTIILTNELVGKTEVVGMSPTPREYYDPITGGGLGAQNYMWTGAVDIIIANELVGQTEVGDVLHDAIGCLNSRTY